MNTKRFDGISRRNFLHASMLAGAGATLNGAAAIPRPRSPRGSSVARSTRPRSRNCRRRWQPGERARSS